MRVRISMMIALWILLIGTPVQSSAQQANIALPEAYLNEPYSQNIADTLRDTYKVMLRTSSKSSTYEWRAIGAFPQGLGLDPNTGTVFGTPKIASPRGYQFRVQVLDRSLANPAPLSLLVSLRVLRKPPGEAPVLTPIDSTGDTKVNPIPTVPAKISAPQTVLTASLDSIEPLVIDAPTPKPEEEDQCTRITDEPQRDTVVDRDGAPGYDSDDAFVIIDANTGKILEGATKVDENARVKVVFVNKNPFKYDYSFQLTPKDVASATVISFLGLIPGIPSIPGVLTGTITPAASAKDKSDLTAALGQAVVNANAARARLAAAPGPQPAIPEDKCKEFTAKVQMVVANSELIAKTIKGESDLLTTANDQYKKFLTETDKTFSQGNRTARIAFAKKLCASATAVLPKLKAVATIDFDAFSKSLKLDVFAANVTLLDDGLSSSNCADTALLKKVIDGLKLDVANYKTKVDDLRKAIADSQKSLETPTKIIKAALGSSGSFAEAAYAPSLGDATSVSVAITRKNLRDENPKDEVVAVSRPIEIGEPRVVLSGGIGFSTINERKISRQVSCT